MRPANARTAIVINANNLSSIKSSAYAVEASFYYVAALCYMLFCASQRRPSLLLSAPFEGACVKCWVVDKLLRALPKDVQAIVHQAQPPYHAVDNFVDNPTGGTCDENPSNH